MSTAHGICRARVLVPAGLVYILVLAALIGWSRTPRSFPALPFWFGSILGDIALGNWTPNALRPAIVPWFLGAVWWLGGGTHAAVLVKNLLLQPLYLFSLYRIASRSRARFAAGCLVAFALTCPVLIFTSYAIVPAEGWLTPLLAFVVVYLLYPDHDFSLARVCLLGLAVALLLSKSSMRFLCPVLVLLFALRYPDRRVAATMGVFVLASFASWGAYNYAATGEVHFASEGDGYNLYKGNNPMAVGVYPADLDGTSRAVLAVAPPGLGPPWRHSEWYVEQTFEFWRSEPASAYRLFLLRIYVVFLAVAPFEVATAPPIKLTGRIISTIYVLLFRVALLFGLFYSLIQLARWVRGLIAGGEGSWRPDARASGSLVFLGTTLGFAAPYLVAMAWERHIIPLFVPTLMFATWILDQDADSVQRVASRLLPQRSSEER